MLAARDQALHDVAMMQGGTSSDGQDFAAKQAKIAAEFNAWAPTYESGRLAPWYQMHAREVFKHLDLSGARRVLDIGCGTGWALRQLAKQHHAIEFIGIDLAPDMIAMAKEMASAENLANLAFFEADWEEFGQAIADGSHAEIKPGFDCILALSSLHYVADINTALASIRDSLYAGGSLVLVERDTRSSILTNIWGALHKFVIRDGVEFIDTEELLEMMRSTGFEPVSVLSSKQQFMRHGKLFTSVAVVKGVLPGGNAEPS